MALSHPTLSSFRYSLIKTHQSAYPRKKPDTKSNLIGKLPCIYNCTIIQSSYGLHHHKGGFRLASVDSYLPKASPIKAYSHAGAEDFTPPSERSLHARQVWSFSRPTFLIVIFLQFDAIVARTWMHHTHPTQLSTLSFLLMTIVASVALLCGQVFTNGINQIYDVEIDRVSKPHLPLVSGELSINNAWLMTASFGMLSLLVASSLNFGPFLVFMVGLLMFMGYTYNLPPLALKFSTYGAIFSNAMTSGLLNLLYAHLFAKAALGLPFQFSPGDAFTIITTTITALVNGFMKDLADLEGDMKCNVPTLASKLGLRKTTYLGVGCYLINYIGGILAAISMPQAFKSSIVIPAHLLFSFALIFEVRKLEKQNYTKEARTKFHMFLVSLFALEYLVYVLM